MESEMLSSNYGTPEESTAEISAVVDGDGAFRDRVAHLRTWAVVASSRARDLSYEWPAVACALAAFYLLLVVSSTQTFGFLDIGVLLGLLGAGYSLSRFEHNSSVALTKLVKRLADDEDSSSQSSEPSYVRD